jgi:hypothetical protein
MDLARIRQKAIVTATVFGVIPCLLGIGISQYLRWSGIVWLSDTGPFWPVVCLGTSIAILTTLFASSSNDRTTRVCGWVLITWTWLYFPLWFAAKEIPQSSAVVTKDGRTFIASEWARQPSDKVWLLTGRATDRIVRNVAGTATVYAVEVQYRFAKPYISTRQNEEDLSAPVLSAANAMLAGETGRSRSSRIALFENRTIYEQFLATLCRTIVPGEPSCPLKLSLSPQSEATILGAVWSKYYTEKEAIEEKHLPTLIDLLTQENSRLVNRDLVFALFMDLADTPEQLSTVARKPRMLDERHFDELIKRLLVTPGAGNEAVGILLKGSRLAEEQRLALRNKVFSEASLSLIANHAAALHVSDAEIAQIAPRMRASLELTADAAMLALEKFGQRLPLEVQQEAIMVIVNAKASHAFTALKHVNFSSTWRKKLLDRAINDGTYEDFEEAHLSREMLEDLLSPSEMRSLIARVMQRSRTSSKWLNFAIHALPIRAMTLVERKTIIDELAFESAKSAFEFISEYRYYFDEQDVDEVTHDYTKTITPDFCLHLSHRNRNRKLDYFSEAQLRIFRDCAQLK